jgi:hypothetical protein
MLRSTISLLYICCVLSSSGQDNQISWQHDFQLDWSDFQQRVGQGGVFKAFTFSGIQYEVRDLGGIVAIEVESYFLPGESWAFQDYLSDELLAHEELHFHITEIYARKMRRDFTKFEIDIEEFASNKMIEELKTKYNSLYDEMELLQKRYDSETDHGAGSQAQIDWEEWIDVQLKMTNAYSKMNHETTSH